MMPLSDVAAAELGEIVFHLPSEPVAPTILLLLGAVREVQRAGAAKVPIIARDALAAELQVLPPSLTANWKTQTCLHFVQSV
jgi:hypothetical protein